MASFSANTKEIAEKDSKRHQKVDGGRKKKAELKSKSDHLSDTLKPEWIVLCTHSDVARFSRCSPSLSLSGRCPGGSHSRYFREWCKKRTKHCEKKREEIEAMIQAHAYHINLTNQIVRFINHSGGRVAREHAFNRCSRPSSCSQNHRYYETSVNKKRTVHQRIARARAHSLIQNDLLWWFRCKHGVHSVQMAYDFQFTSSAMKCARPKKWSAACYLHML